MVTPVLWDNSLTGYLFFEDDCSFFLHQAVKVVYYLLAITLYFILPSLLMPYLYGHILYVAYGSYKKVKNNLDQHSRSSSFWIQIKLSAMVVLVYLSFLITFLPYFALFIIDLLEGGVNDLHYQIAAYLMNIQAMCNFIIYGAVNPEFRNAYKRLLCHKFVGCRKRRASITVSPLVIRSGQQ